MLRSAPLSNRISLKLDYLRITGGKSRDELCGHDVPPTLKDDSPASCRRGTQILLPALPRTRHETASQHDSGSRQYVATREASAAHCFACAR